jgi:uncharacterized membrane protein YecN with MAPEG domain
VCTCDMMNDIKEKKTRAKKHLITRQQVSANVGEYIPSSIALLSCKKAQNAVWICCC